MEFFYYYFHTRTTTFDQADKKKSVIHTLRQGIAFLPFWPERVERFQASALPHRYSYVKTANPVRAAIAKAKRETLKKTG